MGIAFSGRRADALDEMEYSGSEGAARAARIRAANAREDAGWAAGHRDDADAERAAYNAGVAAAADAVSKALASYPEVQVSICAFIIALKK